MIRHAYKLTALISVLLTVYTVAGCTDSKSKGRDEYIIRVEDRVVTVLDFNRAFEIAKAAYPHNAMQRPADIRDVQLRLLNQMTEEMILLERAKELGIIISDSEVEKTISEIKGDYPENVFNQMLLEYAVPYHSWKKGLVIRLLMEKVVAKELGEQIVLTPDDISKY